EEGEGSARLQGDNSTELEIAPPARVGCVCREVRYKPMARILIRVGTLCCVIELINGKIDERGEIAVVDGMGVGVVRYQVEILNALDRADGSTMVIGVGHVVVVVLESSAKRLQA